MKELYAEDHLQELIHIFTKNNPLLQEAFRRRDAAALMADYREYPESFLVVAAEKMKELGETKMSQVFEQLLEESIGKI